MKFKDPKTPRAEMDNYFNSLIDEIDNEFRKLQLG